MCNILPISLDLLATQYNINLRKERYVHKHFFQVFILKSIIYSLISTNSNSWSKPHFYSYQRFLWVDGESAPGTEKSKHPVHLELDIILITVLVGRLSLKKKQFFFQRK